MKKTGLIILLIGIALNLNAQSVLGIPFGSSYEKTKELLEARFGKVGVVRNYTAQY